MSKEDKVKKIYIAGPMSGYTEFNFPKFNRIAQMLRDEGWTVFNPANKTEETGVKEHSSYGEGNALELVGSGWDFREAYTWDVNRVIEADAIFMLKGWEHSPGARGEWAVAVSMQSKYPETYRIIYEN